MSTPAGGTPATTSPAPRVSVILPTRNRAGLLPRAVRSILGQTFTALEVIVVDDASTDNTREVLADLAEADPRVRTVHLPKPGGAAAARNRGIALARGEFVALLDDDDEWLPAKLEQQLEKFRRAHGDVGIVHCPYVFVAGNGREEVRGRRDGWPESALHAILRNCFVGHSTALVRRDLLLDVRGYDERLPRLQDWDLWIRLSKQACFASVPTPLVRVYHSEASISTSSRALVAAARILEAKFEADTGLSRAELADGYHSLGHLLMIGGAPGEGARLLRRSLRHRPWPPQRVVSTLLAALGERPYGALGAVHRRWVEG